MLASPRRRVHRHALSGAYRLLKRPRASRHQQPTRPIAESSSTGFSRWYGRLISALMDRPGRRMAFYGTVVGLLLLSMGLVAGRIVQVKMLPFDNKSEFQVILDPAGRHHPGEQRGTGRRGGGLSPRRARGPQYPGVRRYRRALQLQRTGAALLHAPGRQRSRRSGQPGGERRSLTAEPRHCRGGASCHRFDRPALRSPVPRSPRSHPVRRCSRPWSPRSMPEATARGWKQQRRVKWVFESTPGVVDVDWTVEAPQAATEPPGGSGAGGRRGSERRGDRAYGLPGPVRAPGQGGSSRAQRGRRSRSCRDCR